MSNLIHPRFSLCGIKYDNDLVLFKEKLTSLFKTNEEKNYVDDICNFISQWIDDNPYILCHSSGSTGAPKDILLPKTTMINSARKTGEFYGLGEGSKTLLCLPIQYIAGRMMIVRAMTLGWEMDIKLPDALSLENSGKIYDFVAVVQLQLYKGIKYLSFYKTILVGGGAVSLSFIEELATSDIKSRIYISYGMTETASHVAIRELYPHHSNYYTAVNNVSFSTNDDDCLVINAPDLNPLPLTTNDVVKLIDSHNFEWIGRRDYVINSGGIKIHPEESEKILSSIITSRYIICGEKDETLGERQILIIEGERDDYPTLDDFMDSHFDRIHRPKKTYYIKSFPLTATGKINRIELLKMIK